MNLVEFTEKGLYCPPADVYIDPWRPVERAVITHGHADHAKWGHKHYLCTDLAKPVMQYRLGPEMRIESMPFGERRSIHGVNISFHPAGHIIGSAQVRLEYKGEIWVISGDYKVQVDGLTRPFEPIRCHAFITESTFGLPVYKWKPQTEVMGEINAWWQQNKEAGRVSILSGYSLGKAQRILHDLDTSIGPILTHGAVENTNEVIRAQGIHLPETIRVTRELDKKTFKGGLVIAPPGALGSSWVKKFRPYSIGVASGWMSLRGARRRRAADRGFVLSDHADWEGLNETIVATGAEKVFVTHGYTGIFTQWLREQGYDAHEVSTEYEGELGELNDRNTEEDDAS
jgi:putative mRNA 3-end processing factor